MQAEILGNETERIDRLLEINNNDFKEIMEQLYSLPERSYESETHKGIIRRLDGNDKNRRDLIQRKMDINLLQKTKGVQRYVKRFRRNSPQA